jgi:hypothetical protein
MGTDVLDLVTASRFDRRTSSGKTWPCLLSCTRADGDETEVVAKFSAGCERQVGGLVAEAIAAILAADLDLPVPEACARASTSCGHIQIGSGCAVRHHRLHDGTRQ